MNRQNARRNKVVVGMSGGVDSSVTAALLVEQGYEVLGITLETWKEQGAVERSWLDRSCCKIGLARYVADRLKISHQVIDAQDLFREAVIQNFLDEYASGRTPNPCVRCNERIKFGLLLKIATELGADFLATGHYARVFFDAGTGRYRMKKGVDASKDQSYFLYRLNQAQLGGVIFPLGGLLKNQVWGMAADLDLPPEEVAESQEICFVNEGDYRTFLQGQRPELNQEGIMIDTEGHAVGRHQGVAFYTIGQRRGLGISTPGAATRERIYVTGLDPATNRVEVGPEGRLYRKDLMARELNLIQPDQFQEGNRREVTAKIRYGACEARAIAWRVGTDRLHILFEEPQRAVTPGQSVVLYEGEEVLGGGVIEAPQSGEIA